VQIREDAKRDVATFNLIYEQKPFKILRKACGSYLVGETKILLLWYHI